MPDRFRCRVENATVRSGQRDALADLIHTLFARRHHPLSAGQEKDWLTVELVQSLREESRVYREELSSETEGPLPFALGYFRLRDDRLELVSDEIPANMAPRPFVRFLSEFVEPGARLWFAGEDGEEKWEVRDVGTVVEHTTSTDTAEPQADDDGESAGASH